MQLNRLWKLSVLYKAGRCRYSGRPKCGYEIRGG